jgi:hypothetical protein
MHLLRKIQSHFIRQNRNEKLQPLTMNDIRKEINLLKKEVAYLKKKVGQLETQTSEENAYKTDLWERQEIKELKSQVQMLNSGPPPLEDVPTEEHPNINLFETTDIEGINAMRIMAIQHQKYHVLIKIKIQDQVFKLKSLIDSGSDLNILHKDIIPSIYWNKTDHSVIGLGNKSIQMNYEIPKATMCFRDYCLDLKFLLSEIPIACILGTPFLEAIEPHGSERTPEGKQGILSQSLVYNNLEKLLRKRK